MNRRVLIGARNKNPKENFLTGDNLFVQSLYVVATFNSLSNNFTFDENVKVAA
jgi:hypothetical protein